MKQTIIKLTLPKGIECSPEGFRQIVAGITESENKVIFHRDENGETINTYPNNRWFGRNKKWLGFISEVKEGEQEQATSLLPHLPKVIDKLTNGANVDIKMSMETREKKIIITEAPIIYTFSRCILKNRTSKTQGLSGQQVVERSFWGLIQQAYKDGLLISLPDQRDIQIKLFDARRNVVKTHPSANEYSEMWSGEFAVNVDLKGYWQFGQLQHRGYGMLFKDMRGASK